MGDLDKVIADLKAIAETLKTADPVKEHQAEWERLGDGKLASEINKVLQGATAKLDEISAEISKKLSEQPVITAEELSSLKTKVTEGEKAIAELAEMKAKASMEKRMAELVEVGLRLEGDQAKAQEDRIRPMSDEEFVSYKGELSAVKASVESALKKADDATKAKAEEEAKVKAQAEADAKAEAEKTPAKAEVEAGKEKEKSVAVLNKSVDVSKDKRIEWSKL